MQRDKQSFSHGAARKASFSNSVIERPTVLRLFTPETISKYVGLNSLKYHSHSFSLEACVYFPKNTDAILASLPELTRKKIVSNGQR